MASVLQQHIGRRSALDGLKVIEASDAPRYRAAMAAGRQLGWGYFFPYLLARHKPERSVVYLGEDDGSMCVFLKRQRKTGTRLDVLLAPAPMNVRVLERCLERANEFNGDFGARVMKMDVKDVEMVGDFRQLRVKQRKSQYVFAPRAFESIRGNRYRTLRRNVALVEALPDVEVRAFEPGHAQGCKDVLQRWRDRHREAHGTTGAAGTTSRAIDLAARERDIDLRGQVVLINGRISAFSLGGGIRPGLACYFEAKNDFNVPGLSYFLRRSFMLSLGDFDMVNDGSDTGRRGLKQLKDSLRPVAMHAEYRGYQRAG